GPVADARQGLLAVDVDVNRRRVRAVVEGPDLGGRAAGGRGRGGREGQDEGGGQDCADQDAESCHYMTSCKKGARLTRPPERPPGPVAGDCQAALNALTGTLAAELPTPRS